LCLFLTVDLTSAPGSFLFSLRNNDDLAPFKAPLKNESDEAAMFRYHSAGPVFGLGIDLAIGGNAGYARFGRTYQAPPGYTYGETNTSSLLAGSEVFDTSEIEVFY
jgi:hypothetical protein